MATSVRLGKAGDPERQATVIRAIRNAEVDGLVCASPSEVGGCRMGSDPETSVVDKFGRSHDIANLFVCDGSIFPTQGSANPGLTIQALAARTADYLISQGDRVFTSDSRDMTTPRIRKALAPPETWGKGVPRLT